MQSHSMTEVEIQSLQSQQRPDADVHQPDSGNHAMARGRGLDPRTHSALEAAGVLRAPSEAAATVPTP